MKKLLLMLSMITASSALYPSAGKIAAFLGAASSKIGVKATNFRQKYGSLVLPSLVGGGLFAVGEVYGKDMLGAENALEKPLNDFKGEINVQQGEIKAQQAHMINAIMACNVLLMGMSGALGVSTASEPTTWYGKIFRNSRIFFDGSKSVLGDIAHAVQLLGMFAKISGSAYAYACAGSQDERAIPVAAAAVPVTPVLPQKNKPAVARKIAMKKRR